MVLVETMDGVTHKVSSWNVFHPTSKIKQIFLTDGEDIVCKIGGFDKYFVRKDAIAVMGQGGGVCSITVYGFTDTTIAEKELLDSYNSKIATIVTEGKDTDSRLAACKKKYEVLVSKLKSKSVYKTSITVHNEYCGLNKEKVDSKWFKDGQGSQVTAEGMLGKGYQRHLKV